VSHGKRFWPTRLLRGRCVKVLWRKRGANVAYCCNLATVAKILDELPKVTAFVALAFAGFSVTTAQLGTGSSMPARLNRVALWSAIGFPTALLSVIKIDGTQWKHTGEASGGDRARWQPRRDDKGPMHLVNKPS
jgi:hypothetical protein